MTGIQNEYVETNFLRSEFAEVLYNNILFQKIDNLEQQLSGIKDQVNKNEQNVLYFYADEVDKISVRENENKKGRVKKKTGVQTDEDERWQGTQKIVDRALEILTEWEDAEDIKVQIQYAAIIAGKIDNIKKKDVIHADDIRNKICTLLKNVIRLNASEEVLTKVQISVLKEGFSLITAGEIQKEDLLWLNRKLRKKGLATMPAWD